MGGISLCVPMSIASTGRGRGALSFLLCAIACIWLLPQEIEGVRHFLTLQEVPPTAFFVGNFAFDGEGKLGLRLSNITLNGAPPRGDTQRAIGFMVKRSSTDRRDFLQTIMPDTCPFRTELQAFEMRHLLPPKAEELRVQSSIRVDAPGFYSVYFVHCSAGELISGEMEVAFLNRGSQLAIGEQPMTMVLGALLPLYGAGWYAWMSRAPAAAWSQSQTQRRIRQYTSGLWALRTLFVACDLGRLLWARSSGWPVYEGYTGALIYYGVAWAIAVVELIIGRNTWIAVQAHTMLQRHQWIVFFVQVILLAPYLLHDRLLTLWFPFFEQHPTGISVLYVVLTAYSWRALQRTSASKKRMLPFEQKEERGSYRLQLLRTLYLCGALLYLCLTLEETFSRALYFRLTWVGHLLSKATQLFCVCLFSYQFILFQSKTGDSPPRSSSSTLPGERSPQEDDHSDEELI